MAKKKKSPFPKKNARQNFLKRNLPDTRKYFREF